MADESVSIHDEPHRTVQGGAARAAVFGINDGLVSNVSLILGMAGAAASPGVVRLAGLAGLLAGAFSMAAGEYVSMKAQEELLAREIERERREIREHPDRETEELARIYERRGLARDTSRRVAAAMMEDPEVALDVHAREELGVDPDELGSPVAAAVSSFVAFSIGAAIPLVPWLFAGGGAATVTSLVLALVAAVAVGAALARFTARSYLRSIARQVLVAGAAAGVTYLVGSAIGVGVA
ncbi:MAG: VIT1/CCC1 transporter family protein [Nitriliruptorales bacterium]|nr:VIT1/CCC1 transporter family protein [Nitriliruptorales bacterium]